MHRSRGDLPERVYFPGLNALRFFAAFSVLVQHAENFPTEFGLPYRGLLGKWCLTGHDGVGLFFVLSGFLITYLLLAEQGATGGIRVGRFYLRRALRIWPLYYLTVVLGFAVLPATVAPPAFNVWNRPDAPGTLLLFLLLLPNVALCWCPPVLGASLLWSVGVEEQFYLAWPLFLKAARRFLLPALVVLIVGKLVLAYGLGVWVGDTTPFGRGLLDLVDSFRLEYLALGGAGACFVCFDYRRILRLVYHPAAQLLAAALLVGVILPWSGCPRPPEMVTAGVFLVVILNVACNPRRLVSFENRCLNLGGKLSYGIYVFHPGVMVLACRLMQTAGLLVDGPGTTVPLVLDVATFGGTMVAAWFSYRFFEKPFLAFKDRFAIVPSGEAGPVMPAAGGPQARRPAA